MRIQHARLRRRFVSAVRENIPAAEDDVVQLRQLHEILDFRRTTVRALSQANRGHLGERSDWLGLFLANEFYAGHKRCGYRAHTRHQNPKVSPRGSNLRWFFHEIPRLNCRWNCTGYSSNVPWP